METHRVVTGACDAQRASAAERKVSGCPAPSDNVDAWPTT